MIGTDVLGYPVIGSDSDLESLAKKYTYALVTVGQIRSSEARIKLFNLAVKAGFILPSIVSPNAYVSRYASLGNGVVVMHGALVNINTTISDNCIVNSKALIEHDCQIFKHCHISTNATINGGVTVEEGCFIGSGAITKESIIIKRNSFIKAGSVAV